MLQIRTNIAVALSIGVLAVFRSGGRPNVAGAPAPAGTNGRNDDLAELNDPAHQA
jgi:hypothetical protein